MTPDQMMALGTAFAAYLRIFEVCIAYQPTAEHLHSYCRGLLSDLARKSIEPIALACGTAVRTLQEFLRDHVWDQFRMRDLLQQRLLGLPALNAADDLGTIGLIDETSVAKKGTKTPGVHRQYCGARGKIENCIVTVHLGIVRGLFKTLIDAALFLPKIWSDDRERCREAKIPDDLVFGTSYVGEIPRNFRCLTKRPRGKRPKKGWKGKRIDNLARHSSAWYQQNWQNVSLARLTLDKQEWDVRAGQVYLLRRGELSDRTYLLIVARDLATGEVKYFISNAPADTPLEKLLRVAFTRWNVEHAFRVVKSEIGFGHFEGRSYVALMRHMILCLIVMGFVAEHTDRLRGEKSGDHDGASVPSPEPALPDLADESPKDNRSSPHGRGHRLSPAA